MEQADNRLVIAGRLHRNAELRITPAGIPIARFVLAHTSRHMEAGQPRDVECRLSVVASGESLVAVVKPLSAGDWIKVEGFVCRAGYRAPDTRIELHAMNIQTVGSNG